jgi:hypothetical protein
MERLKSHSLQLQHDQEDLISTFFIAGNIDDVSPDNLLSSTEYHSNLLNNTNAEFTHLFPNKGLGQNSLSSHVELNLTCKILYNFNSKSTDTVKELVEL